METFGIGLFPLSNSKVFDIGTFTLTVRKRQLANTMGEIIKNQHFQDAVGLPKCDVTGRKGT